MCIRQEAILDSERWTIYLSLILFCRYAKGLENKAFTFNGIEP